MAVNYKEAAEFISNDLRLKNPAGGGKISQGQGRVSGKDQTAFGGAEKAGDHLYGGHHGPGLRLDGGVDPGRPDLRPGHDHVRVH